MSLIGTSIICATAIALMVRVMFFVSINPLLGNESWPTYDKSKLENDTYEMVVQVNGVLRGKVQVPVSYTEVEMKETAKKIENVKMRIDGKTIVKEIVVPKKLVNIVVK